MVVATLTVKQELPVGWSISLEQEGGYRSMAGLIRSSMTSMLLIRDLLEIVFVSSLSSLMPRKIYYRSLGKAEV